MRSALDTCLAKIMGDRRQRAGRIAVLALVTCLAFVSVSWALHQPGISYEEQSAQAEVAATTDDAAQSDGVWEESGDEGASEPAAEPAADEGIQVDGAADEAATTDTATEPAAEQPAADATPADAAADTAEPTPTPTWHEGNVPAGLDITANVNGVAFKVLDENGQWVATDTIASDAQVKLEVSFADVDVNTLVANAGQAYIMLPPSVDVQKLAEADQEWGGIHGTLKTVDTDDTTAYGTYYYQRDDWANWYIVLTLDADYAANLAADTTLANALTCDIAWSEATLTAVSDAAAQTQAALVEQGLAEKAAAEAAAAEAAAQAAAEAAASDEAATQSDEAAVSDAPAIAEQTAVIAEPTVSDATSDAEAAASDDAAASDADAADEAADLTATATSELTIDTYATRVAPFKLTLTQLVTVTAEQIEAAAADAAANNGASDADAAASDTAASDDAANAKASDFAFDDDDAASNANDANDGIATVADGDTSDDAKAAGVNMSGYITSVSFQKKNGVIWEESTEFTTADQARATMNFENIYSSTIKENNNTIYIDLPAYIDCSKFTGTYDTYDGSTHSGKYTYEKNADGTYRIVLVLDDDYVNNAGDTIGGSLQFNFQWTKDAVDDSGTKKVEIGNWSGDLKITEDNSGDNKPSSANYSIYKQAGSLQIDENGIAYIDYTVTLTVKNGMTAPITMKDELSTSAFTYDGAPSVTGGDVKVNFSGTTGQGTGTTIQLWPNSGSTVDPGTYTIKYRVKSLNSVTDPGTTVPSEVKNTVTVPEKGDNTISSETHTTTTSGVINKQGQLVSGSDATYIDYTVYLNAGTIIKNLKEPANFTDTLPDTLELQGDVTVKQYDVTGKEVGSGKATVNGQNISFTTPTGQYYYVITYRTKVKDSELPVGGSVTIKNDGKSTGGVDGSSSSEITITNHKLTKSLTSGSTSKDLVRTSNWVSNVAVKGDLEGYVYEDWSNYIDDATSETGKSRAMDLVEGSVVVKDASGNVVSSDLYTLEAGTHQSSDWSSKLNQQVNIDDGLFKITFKKGVTGPVTIEYQTTTDMSKLTYGYVINYASLSKDGHTDPAQAQDTFQITTDNHNIIIKKQSVYQWDDTSGTTTLNPGDKSIPWVILVNRGHTLTSDLTITDTLPEGLTFLPETFDIQIRSSTIKDAEGVTWSYDESTRKLTVNIKASVYYPAADQDYASNDITILFSTQLPDSFFEGTETSKVFSNTATVEANGSQTDSTYDQTVTRQVVGKSGSYDKNTHVLSYNVVINPDNSNLNGGNTLTVTDTLDAGSIADYVSLQSLEVFTAVKTTDASGNVKVEPGTFVQELKASDSGEVFTYTLDESGKTFTTYMPDGQAYVIVAKYYVDIDVTQAVQMKNTVSIKGNDNWKKEDSSTNVDQNTSGETHTNKVTIVKHDTASYSTKLQGASFKLEKYENNAWATVGSATTGSDGTASINPVSFNTLYKLGETQAPDGYVLDEGPTYFIVATTGTSEADAKANLPESIEGESAYSKDAVKVYYAKNGTNDYINVEIDRYNTKDTTKVNPGELRVTKVWADGSGNVVTDPTTLNTKPEVEVTLTKHVANTGHKITLKTSGQADKVFAENIYDGAYIYAYGYSLKWDSADLGSATAVQSGTMSDTDYTPVWKIGPITSDITIDSSDVYWNCGTFLRQEGGTAPSGTTDTVIGTVTLNAANDWTYLWKDLDRSAGVTYTITETTVDGYETSYTLNGSELKEGTTFTPSEKGDKVTITNKSTASYELPETGGTGVAPYIAAGLGLVAFAGIGYSLRRKQEGGMGDLPTPRL